MAGTFKRSPRSEAVRYTLKDFQKEFPTDDAVLEWLKDRFNPEGIHCPQCNKITGHSKLTNRRAYSCQICGHHYYPTASTIFHKSTTPLTYWMYAIFSMSKTRCGMSAKQLEREIGVTYKTAWRMFKQIRSMLDDGPSPFDGPVEVDEAYYGSKDEGGKRGRGAGGKSVMVGIADRDDSKIMVTILPDASANSLTPFVSENVEPQATVYTDEWAGYARLTRCGFNHERCSHADGQYVIGNAHTNTIEGFWGLLKGGLTHVYRFVEPQYLQQYANEYAFRYNHRNDPESLFKAFAHRIAKA
ncbi:MAG: IS1595 family transposase [bacterium]|nr:IS1595 family transposase [bacterium]